MSAEAFAAEVGIPVSVIRAIESRQRILQPEQAAIIARATGADPTSLFDATPPFPRAFGTDHPYSREAYLFWAGLPRNRPSDDRTAIQYAEVLKEEIEVLLFASMGSTHPKFQPVVAAICEAIRKIEEDFKLTTAIKLANVRSSDRKSQEYDALKEKAFLFRLLGDTAQAQSHWPVKNGSGFENIKMGQKLKVRAETYRKYRTILLEEIQTLIRGGKSK